LAVSQIRNVICVVAGDPATIGNEILHRSHLEGGAEADTFAQRTIWMPCTPSDSGVENENRAM
jgi:hypothetical protein